MEASYHELWSRLGLSIDWSFTYTTIGPYATKVSQRAFLRLLEKGVAYRAESPTLWDVDLRTAVAQAELEDREVPGVYQRIVFQGPDGSDLLVDTTRPELLPACVALVAHPDDQRYQAALRKMGDHTAVRGVGPDRRPPSRRPGEGDGPGDDLHLW